MMATAVATRRLLAPDVVRRVRRKLDADGVPREPHERQLADIGALLDEARSRDELVDGQWTMACYLKGVDRCFRSTRKLAAAFGIPLRPAAAAAPPLAAGAGQDAARAPDQGFSPVGPEGHVAGGTRHSSVEGLSGAGLGSGHDGAADSSLADQQLRDAFTPAAANPLSPNDVDSLGAQLEAAVHARRRGQVGGAGSGSWGCVGAGVEGPSRPLSATSGLHPSQLLGSEAEGSRATASEQDQIWHQQHQHQYQGQHQYSYQQGQDPRWSQGTPQGGVESVGRQGRACAGAASPSAKRRGGEPKQQRGRKRSGGSNNARELKTRGASRELADAVTAYAGQAATCGELCARLVRADCQGGNNPRLRVWFEILDQHGQSTGELVNSSQLAARSSLAAHKNGWKSIKIDGEPLESWCSAIADALELEQAQRPGATRGGAPALATPAAAHAPRTRARQYAAASPHADAPPVTAAAEAALSRSATPNPQPSASGLGGVFGADSEGGADVDLDVGFEGFGAFSAQHRLMQQQALQAANPPSTPVMVGAAPMQATPLGAAPGSAFTQLQPQSLSQLPHALGLQARHGNMQPQALPPPVSAQLFPNHSNGARAGAPAATPAPLHAGETSFPGAHQALPAYSLHHYPTNAAAAGWPWGMHHAMHYQQLAYPPHTPVERAASAAIGHMQAEAVAHPAAGHGPAPGYGAYHERATLGGSMHLRSWSQGGAVQLVPGAMQHGWGQQSRGQGLEGMQPSSGQEEQS